MGLSIEEQRRKGRDNRPDDFHYKKKKKKKVKIKKPYSDPVKKKSIAGIIANKKDAQNRKSKSIVKKIANSYRNELTIKATKSELFLKEVFDERSINYKFQEIITYDGNKRFYIVDFLIGRLVIELDGRHHYKGEQLTKDIARDKCLKKKRYKVLRIENSDLYRDWKSVERRLINAGVRMR